MTHWLWPALVSAGLAIAFPQSALALDTNAPISTAAPIVTDGPPISVDDLVLLEVDATGVQLSDAFSAYSSRHGLYLPVGALARLLDFAIDVDPQRGRAEGWAVTPDRRILIDAARHVARAGEVDLALDSADAVVFDDDLYVRSTVLEQMLPIRFEASISDLTLHVTPTVRLPFQDRLDREHTGRLLDAETAQAPPLQIETPYTLFTPPSADFNLNVSGDGGSGTIASGYEARLAGDLLWSGFEAFMGSDSDLELNTMRVLLTRKDPNGRIAGPFGATRSALGDTFTPGLSLGAQSAGGRGVYITSQPLDQVSAFDTIDIRGELPLGYQVELYVNEVLRGSQFQPVEGRYGFEHVSLAYGYNVVRLVFYGPRGERREEVRHINVGENQLRKGQMTYRVGAVQENTPVIRVGDNAQTLSGERPWRVVGAATYGLTDAVTVTAAGAQYSPTAAKTRRMASVGVMTSLGGVSLEMQAARDDLDGAAVSAGVAGRLGRLSYLLRRAEYSGGFIDEVRGDGDTARPLQSATEVNLDTVLNVLGAELPATLRAKEERFETGETRIAANASASKAIDHYLVSARLDYERGLAGDERLDSAFDVSSPYGETWQVRAAATVRLSPEARLGAATLTADRNIGDRTALHLGVSHDFETDNTTFDAGHTWRLRTADFSITGAYDVGEADFRIGARLSISLGYDPSQRRYRRVQPGAAAGGAMAVETFVDGDGDGRHEPNEAALSGVVIRGGRELETTDAHGRSTIYGLGDGASAQVQIDMSSIDDPYLTPTSTTVQITPRPGRVSIVALPISVFGEVELMATFQRAEESPRAISALRIELLDSNGRVVGRSSSEFDGSVLFDRLRPGTYSVRLDPAQAERLRLRLSAPVNVVVRQGGGFSGRVAVRVAPILAAQVGGLQ